MVVPLPTPPIVRPLISLLVVSSKPAYSIRTYLKIPELSASLVPTVPPKVALAGGLLGTPSICTRLAWLEDALPRMITPDQSPEAGVAAAEVKIIGLAQVPSARILAPRQTTRTPPGIPLPVLRLPLIVVPASTIRTSAESTYTRPLKRQARPPLAGLFRRMVSFTLCPVPNTPLRVGLVGLMIVADV